MKTYLTTLLLIVSFGALAQTSVSAKDFIRSANTATKDTSVWFKAAGYADYSISIPNDGTYSFTLYILNDQGAPTYVYLRSPAMPAWLNSYIPLRPNYQAITIKANLTAGTNSVRLYFGDAVTVSRFTYAADGDFSQVLSRLALLEQKITAMQKGIDTMPTLYIEKGYGTATNPIKP